MVRTMLVGLAAVLMLTAAACGGDDDTDEVGSEARETATVRATATRAPEGSATAAPTRAGSPAATAAPTRAGSPAAAATRPAPMQFTEAAQVVDATKSYTATLKTAKGDIVIQLFADKAPRTVNTFVFLATRGYFDGLTFHRVVAGFVVQGGDPLDNGTGGPGFQTEEDPNDLLNTRGRISMAKAGAVTNFGSQFFINLQDNPNLDVDVPGRQKRFYPFGEVVQGMDVVDRIAQRDVIEKVTIEVK